MLQWDDEEHLITLKREFEKIPIQHMPVVFYAMIDSTCDRKRYSKQIPMSLLSSDLIGQVKNNNLCFKHWVLLPHPSLHIYAQAYNRVALMLNHVQGPWLQDIHKMCDCTRLYHLNIGPLFSESPHTGPCPTHS